VKRVRRRLTNFLNVTLLLILYFRDTNCIVA
jgi:hypothetical protein